jgi:SAM-dependent methyltransferase
MACGWCAAPLTPVGRRTGYTVKRCETCGAYTTAPSPTDAELDEAYGTWYRPADGRFGRVGDAILRRTRSHLARRVDDIAPPGRVLDVGAGDGTLVEALIARGRSALGLERSAQGEHMRVAELDSIDGDWAAITMWHSLEHLRSAGTAAEHAGGLLAPRGLLIVAVPNAASLQARAFGERWFGWDLPRHLIHLPAQTLIAGLEARGLSVERVSHWRGGLIVFGWLHGLVGLLPGAPDLYDAIRVPAARAEPMAVPRRIAIVATALVLLPLAAACGAAEVFLRRGGTIYVEARRG